MLQVFPVDREPKAKHPIAIFSPEYGCARHSPPRRTCQGTDYFESSADEKRRDQAVLFAYRDRWVARQVSRKIARCPAQSVAESRASGDPTKLLDLMVVCYFVVQAGLKHCSLVDAATQANHDKAEGH